MKEFLLRHLRKLGMSILVLAVAVGVGLPILSNYLNSRIRSNAENRGYLEHKQITDPRLEGALDFEQDRMDRYEWLYYRHDGENKLVWRDKPTHASVYITVCGQNKISILYDFNENAVQQDTTIVLNLGKGETLHTHFWRSFFFERV